LNVSFIMKVQKSWWRFKQKAKHKKINIFLNLRTNNYKLIIWIYLSKQIFKLADRIRQNANYLSIDKIKILSIVVYFFLLVLSTKVQVNLSPVYNHLVVFLRKFHVQIFIYSILYALKQVLFTLRFLFYSIIAV
jgi:hypothetical protein